MMDASQLADEIDSAMADAIAALPDPFTSADARRALADAIGLAVVAHIQANAVTSDDGESIQ